MLGVVGRLGKQLVLTRAGLPGFQQVDAIRRVDVGECAPDRIDRLRDVAEAIVFVGVKLGGAIIEHAADVGGLVGTADDDGTTGLSSIVIPDAAFERFFDALEYACGGWPCWLVWSQ